MIGNWIFGLDTEFHAVGQDKKETSRQHFELLVTFWIFLLSSPPQCAILSPAFKVREFSITDVVPYSISLKWSSAAEEGLRYDLCQCHLRTSNKELGPRFTSCLNLTGCSIKMSRMPHQFNVFLSVMLYYLCYTIVLTDSLATLNIIIRVELKFKNLPETCS